MLDEQEMDSYLMCVIAVQKLMSIERNQMANIVPAAHHNKVFQSIVQDSIDLIVHDGEVNLCGCNVNYSKPELICL